MSAAGRLGPGRRILRRRDTHPEVHGLVSAPLRQSDISIGFDLNGLAAVQPTAAMYRPRDKNLRWNAPHCYKEKYRCNWGSLIFRWCLSLFSPTSPLPDAGNI